MDKEYLELFKDPRWQKKRLEILSRDKFTCKLCGEKKKQLHVHHTFYDEDVGAPWCYNNKALITLCEDCHSEEHNIMYYNHKETIKWFREGGMLSNEMTKLGWVVFLYKENAMKFIKKMEEKFEKDCGINHG